MEIEEKRENKVDKHQRAKTWRRGEQREGEEIT